MLLCNLFWALEFQLEYLSYSLLASFTHSTLSGLDCAKVSLKAEEHLFTVKSKNSVASLWVLSIRTRQRSKLEEVVVHANSKYVLHLLS